MTIIKILTIFILLIVTLSFAPIVMAINTDLVFSDDFSNDLTNWKHTGTNNATWSINQNNELLANLNNGFSKSMLYTKPFENDSYTEYKLKIKAINGEDKNIAVRVQETNGTISMYGIHIASPSNGIILLEKFESFYSGIDLTSAPISFNNATWYEIKVVMQDNNITVYVDDVQYIDYTDDGSLLGPALTTGGVGLMVTTGAVTPTTVQYDDIQVLVEDDGIINDVPFFAQDDEKWATESYGHVEGMTIESDGCVMTIWAMLLSYYGVDQIEATDSSELVDINPKTLNAWLLEEDQGYFTGGFVNHRPIEDWIDIYRQEHDDSIPELDYIGMDYNNLPATQSATLDTHLSDDEPTMIRVWNDNHAVLAIGKNESTYIINDPLWNTFGYNNINNNRYNNIISSLRRLNNVSNDNVEQITPLRIATNSLSVNDTDKSEIILVYPDSTKILITDSYGGELGFDSTSQTTIQTIENASYVFHPDNNNPNLPPTGEDHVELAIKNPSVLDYTIEILQTEKEDQIQIVTYSSNGKPFSSYLPNTNSLYSLTYDPTTGTSTVKEIPTYTTYQDLIDLINKLRDKGNFLKPKTADVWIKMLQLAETMDNKTNKVSHLTITKLQTLISNLTPKHIDQEGANQLNEALSEFEQNHFE